MITARKPVDVLAVIDRAAADLRVRAWPLRAARAAVAELIEAANSYRRAVADEATLSADHHRRTRWLAADRLDAAIARCQADAA